MKNLGKFLLEKDAHAIIAAFICALLPLFYLPVGFLAVIIVGLVTLQKGAKSGFWVLAWVALPAVATLVLRDIGPFDVLLLRCVLVWGLAALLRRYQSWGLVLEVLALGGVVAILALHFIVPDLHQWWVTTLTTYITEVSNASHWKLILTPAEFAGHVSSFATGIVSFLFLGGVVLELLIAHFWQSVVANNNLFGELFANIRIGRFAAGIALVLLILALVRVPPVMDASPLVILPFLIAGLSLVHYVVRLKKSLIGVMVAIYISLVFLPFFVISGLAVIGFLDVWIDIRDRVRKL